MSGIITAFGATALTLYDGADDLGDGPAYAQYQQLPIGGASDGWGILSAPSGIKSIVKSGLLLADSIGELKTLADALRALKGQRRALYLSMGDGTVRWITARCDNVLMPRSAEHTLFLPVELRFSGIDRNWRGERHGAGWTLDSGEYLDAGLAFDEVTGDVFTLTGGGATVCALTNAGNAPALRPKLTITAGSADITAITITATVDSGAVSLTFAGTVTVGHSLVIDGDALSVLNNAIDAHSSLTRHSTNHTIVELLRIPPGGASYTITLTGGGTGSQAVFSYYNGWA